MSSGALFVEPIVIATGGALTSTNVDGSLDPAAYDVAHPYALDEQATSGESIYQSVQAANTGHSVTDPLWWLRVGAVNRMRMFDEKVGSQTINAESIEVVITPVQLIQVISARNLTALSIRLQQETTAEGVVYDRTIDLADPVADWYEYFFAEIAYQTEALFAGLLPFSDSSFTLTVGNPGGTAGCGELLMGPAVDAGITEMGVQTGIDDYSVVAPDAFGVRDITERDFADNMELRVYVLAGKSPTLTRLLTRNRARPFLLVPSDARPDKQVYGLAESWRCTLTYPDMDVFDITMRGLT